MTGVGGRPEVVLEWSNHLEGEWRESNFHYKPGNLSTAPTFLAIPHQPRLVLATIRISTRIYYGSLPSAHTRHTPWVIQLINRLLQNESSVLALLTDTPPQPVYIRASHYLYHFTSEGADWWSRDNQEEFVPPLSVDHKTVRDFLKEKGL